MAITYLGQILVPRPSGLAFTEDLTPLGLQDGDLVVVGYHVASNTDRAIGVTTAGYTEEAELFANDTYDANLSVSWKVMGSTPDADVSLSSTGSSSHPGHVSIRAYRGVDATTPMDAARTTATGINGLLVNPPAITPVTSGALVVIFGNGAAAQASLATPYASSDLTDFNSGLVSDFYDLAWGVGHYGWTSGAFDAAAWTGPSSAATDSWNAVALALRPAATGGINGTASDTVAVTGSATGAVAIAGAAATTVSVTGAATGAVLVKGAASDTVSVTGAATGVIGASITGQAAGSVGVTGASTGKVRVAGSAASTVSVTGASTGAVRIKGTAAGTVSVTGSAVGAVLGSITGQAADTVTVTGTATGVIGAVSLRRQAYGYESANGGRGIAQANGGAFGPSRTGGTFAATANGGKLQG